jgi:hypothetical protein
VKELDLTEETHNAKLLIGLGDKDNPLGRVNHLHFLLKRFLYSHSGFDRADLDGYLNVFAVMMNPPLNKHARISRIIPDSCRRFA